MRTSQRRTSLFTEDKSTSLPGDSPANRTVKLEKDWGKRTSAISGRRCLERLERLNQLGSWEKTFLELVVGMEGWSSTRCKLTWKMKGTSFNRLYFQRRPSVLPIEEIGFGLLPTPETSQGGAQKDVRVSENGSYYRENSKGVRFGVRVQDVVASGLLPTPDCSDRRSDKSSQRGLSNYARRGKRPTAATKDGKNSTTPQRQ